MTETINIFVNGEITNVRSEYFLMELTFTEKCTTFKEWYYTPQLGIWFGVDEIEFI